MCCKAILRFVKDHMNPLALIAAIIVLLALSLSPVHAVTCQDVRSLTAAEQDYWSRVLNLTSAQRHKIWRACYRNHFREARNFGMRAAVPRAVPNVRAAAEMRAAAEN